MSSSKVEIETLDCARFLGEITKGYRGWWYPGLMGLRGQSKSTGSEKAERLTPRNGGQLLRGWNSDFGNWSTLFETTKPARDRLDLDCCFSFGQQRLKRFDELKLIPIFFLSFFDRIEKISIRNYILKRNDLSVYETFLWILLEYYYPG